MFRKSSCPGCSFAQGQSVPSDREKTGFETKKVHAGHEISIFMPGMKIEISCPAWLLFSSQPSLPSVEPHFMPGMKSGSTCPAWKSAFHARHENRLCMASMKIDSTCWAWKPTWKLPGLYVNFELTHSVGIKSVFYSGWNGISFSTVVSKSKEIADNEGL